MRVGLRDNLGIYGESGIRIGMQVYSTSSNKSIVVTPNNFCSIYQLLNKNYFVSKDEAESKRKIDTDNYSNWQYEPKL